MAAVNSNLRRVAVISTDPWAPRVRSLARLKKESREIEERIF